MTKALIFHTILVTSLVLVTLSSEVIPTAAQPTQQTDLKMGYKRYKRAYVNYEYGYKVKIPVGQTAFADASPSPQHGFYIELRSQAKIWVDGSYNSLMWESLDVAARYYVDLTKKESLGEMSIEAKQITLGGLPAQKILVRYKAQTSGEPIVELLVVALRAHPKNPEIVFTLRLKTTEPRFDIDKAVFDQIVNGFQVKEPHG